MKQRIAIWIIALFGGLTALGGCSSAKQRIEFVNASNTWLNVRFFVEDPSQDSMLTMDEATHAQGAGAYVSEARHQVEPGASFRYDLAWNPNYMQQPVPSVHVMVEPVTPSWMPAAKQHWLELLTPPPVMIVTTGDGEELKFNSGGGTVAVIPDATIREERFDHKIVNVQETDK